MMFDHPEPVQGVEPNWFQTPTVESTTHAITSPMQYGDPSSPRANPIYAGYSEPMISGRAANSDPTGTSQDSQEMARELSNNPDALFENQVFQALIRKTRIETEISKYTEGLFRSLDQTGRVIFLCYAHPDEFADFYGEKDVETLEEQLLASFETGGDLLAELLEQSPGTSDNITLAGIDGA